MEKKKNVTISFVWLHFISLLLFHFYTLTDFILVPAVVGLINYYEFIKMCKYSLNHCILLYRRYVLE